MVLDHITTRAHADHDADLSRLVAEWWRAWTPPLRRPVPDKRPVRLA